jgi:pilus assembly protein CpaC
MQLKLQPVAVVLLLSALIALPAAAENCADFANPEGAIVIGPHMSFVKKTEQPITKVAIADAEVADAELLTPTQVLLVAKEKLAITSLTLWHGDKHADVYQVEVRPLDMTWSDIQEAINRLVPNARVKVERLGNSIVLDGSVGSQGDLDRVLEVVRGFVSTFTNMVSVQGSQQVQLEVKVAEVSRSGAKQLGLGFLLDKNWKIGVFPSGSVSGSLTSGRTVRTTSSPSSTTVIDATTGTVTSVIDQASDSNTLESELLSSATLASPFSSAFQVLAHGMGDDVLALISLLKGQGLSRLLASPTLVAMNGQEAQFLVGGEVPYPVTGQDGNTSVQFKEYGIMLKFRPYLIGGEAVTLNVATEVSSLDYSRVIYSGGTVVPGITTRRGETTLQLKDGQTFAMAGLIREETQSSVSKIPFLGDIPVLGTLFTSKEFQNNESELMIIVTPRLVRALNPGEVPKLPGEDAPTEVSDLDFFLRNRMSSPQEKEMESPFRRTPSFSGEVGYMR